MNEIAESLFDRTLRRFRSALKGDGLASLQKGKVAPELPDAAVAPLREQIDACLARRGGEVSARTRAAALGETYLQLNAIGRHRFLTVLARHYDIEDAAVADAAAALHAAASDEARTKAMAALRNILVPKRVNLLRQFNNIEHGVKFLIDLRADLLEFERKDPSLAALDRDLKGLLASWFDVGFLDLRQVTWETPAALLEKLIRYEAVHEIRSWDDLKNRLDSDRLCFAFFHLRMPDEPLIFVEVALVDGLSDNVQRLLDERAPVQDPNSANTAIFYSISNCQRGLAGVSFGTFLIKRVVDRLSRDYPNIKTFATLSPVPGLVDWLDALSDEALAAKLVEGEQRLLKAMTRAETGAAALRRLLRTPEWHRDADIIAALQAPLMRLSVAFVTAVDDKGRALDRVAHFHLSNGARIERINWLADVSPRGIAQSAGIMANYRYKLDEIERNHESYTGDGQIKLAPIVRKLLKS